MAARLDPDRAATVESHSTQPETHRDLPGCPDSRAPASLPRVGRGPAGPAYRRDLQGSPSIPWKDEKACWWSASGMREVDGAPRRRQARSADRY